MKHRNLQIAWSVAWGAFALLLVALSIRSYWFSDALVYINSAHQPTATRISSRHGAFALEYSELVPLPGVTKPQRRLQYQSADERLIDPASFSFHWGNELFVVFPIWPIALLFGVVGAVPWFRNWEWRFSLRTFLVATTFAAIALGTLIFALQ